MTSGNSLGGSTDSCVVVNAPSSETAIEAVIMPLFHCGSSCRNAAPSIDRFVDGVLLVTVIVHEHWNAEADD